jgi:anti-sigma-K factor RskA
MSVVQDQDIFILLEAVRSLDTADADAFRGYLAAASPQSLVALEVAEGTIAQLPLTLTVVAPAAALKAKVMNRISTERRGATAADKAIAGRIGPRRILPAWARYAAAAVIGIAVGAGAWLMLRGGGTSGGGGGAGRENELVTARSVDLIKFVGLADQSKATGRVVWDKDTNQWHVVIFDMQPPAPGKEYQLWAIDKTKGPIPAGTFTVDAKGKASLIVPVPAGADQVVVAAITQEPKGGSKTPTMPILLKGDVVQ